MYVWLNDEATLRKAGAKIAAGLLNKVIADRLGAVEATVKLHRGRVMEKAPSRSRTS